MNDLTVFIIQSGQNPNFEDCEKAIRNQTVDCLIRYIKDVSPMSTAFQTMIDKCSTKYFIQVDQDMILDNNAVEKLYNKIKPISSQVAILGCMLYDPHLEKNIYGVKIYNREIIRNYPYTNSLSCEVDQIKEFEKDGYRFHFNSEVVGKHSPKWTNELIFERYFNLMEKFKQYKYNWLQHIPKYLFDKVKRHSSEENIYALLGAYTSISQNKTLQNKEKDFHNLIRPELGRFESYFKFPTTANLYMTNKCNFKCQFCLRQCEEIEDHKEITPDLCRKLLTKYPTIKSVCIAGYGEPFLAKNFFPVLNFLKGRGIYVGVITNGSLIHNHFTMLRSSKPNYISVSLNGSNADIHELITGTKTFDKVIENIQLIKNLKIPVYLSMVLAKEWMHDVKPVLKLAKELKIDGVDIHNLLPHTLNKNEEWFEQNVLKVSDHVILNNLYNLKDSDIIRSYPIPINDKSYQTCDSPWKTIGVNGNGSICICNSVYPPDEFFGNINDDSVWFNQGCMSFRDGFLNNTNKACQRCFRNYKNG